MHYRVEWRIDIEANSPREAAERALEIQRDPESTATIFDVADQTFDVYANIAVEPLTGEAARAEVARILRDPRSYSGKPKAKMPDAACKDKASPLDIVKRIAAQRRGAPKHPAYAFLAALGYKHRTDKACASTLRFLLESIEILQPDNARDARKAYDLGYALYMMIRELEGKGDGQ